MSRPVRRLLLDYQPMWIAIGLFFLASVIVVDWGWLFNARGRQAVQWVIPMLSAFAGMSYAPKLPAWQALPVSAADRRRAQWWVWIGLPLVRVVVSMAAPLAVIGPLGGVHAPALEIVSVVECQLLATLMLGALLAGTGMVRRRFGIGAGFAAIVPMVIVGAFASTLTIDGPAMLATGAIAILALAIGTHAAADRIGAAAVRLAERRGPVTRPRIETAGSARGWAALLPYASTVVAIAVIVAVMLHSIFIMIAGHNAPEIVRRRLPGQMTIVVILLSGVSAAAAPFAVRALRSLPMGPARLTAVLQGFVLSVTLSALAAIWLLMAATGMDNSKMTVLLVAAIPTVAFRLPVHFRTGIQLGSFIGMLPMVPLIFLGVMPWANSPGFTAAALLLTAALWVWTWWELAHGRAAYRPPPTGTMRWRGGVN